MLTPHYAPHPALPPTRRTSGIGWEVCKQLLAHNATVFMLGRNPAKGRW